MRVRFYIEKRRDERGELLENDRPIFMSVSFHGSRVMLSTGKKVDRHWWDPGKQRVRDEHPEAVVLNNWLDSLKFTAGVVWKALASLSGKPGAEAFRKEFQRLKPRFSHGFFDVFYLFMEEGSERWAPSTYSKVRTIHNHLRQFQHQSGMMLSFDCMNKEFMEAFRAYYTARRLGEVSLGKAVNTLVWFLNWSTKKGYNIYRDYRDFYRMLKQDRTPVKKASVYLLWEELMDLYRAEIKDTRMERARDLFCLMCFTGIRYNEIKELRKEHIERDRIIVRKTGGKTRIILTNRFARSILQRYENRYYRGNAALPVMSQVTLNKYVRLAARKAGIGAIVHKQEQEHGGSPVKKFEMLTAGAAVMTFIMNALRLDIPPDVIAGYTGVASDIRVQLLQQEIADGYMEKFNVLENG